MFRAFIERARLAAQDLKSGYLHVVHVQSERVIEQREFNDEGPIYFVDLGNERILLLWGQWLYGPHTSLNGDNRVPNDKSTTEEGEGRFPCTEFVVHRTLGLGRILKMEIGGAPLRPVRELAVHATPIAEMNDCELLVGHFDDLPSGISGKSTEFDNRSSV
jgi:hypothetical protein